MELRNQSLRGGAYLTVREAFGMLIRIGGAVIFTRVIGAAEFGILAGSQAIIFVLSLVAQMGVEVSIIRRQDEPDQRAIDAAFSLVAVNGAIAVAMGLVGAGVALGIGVGGHAVAVFAVLLLSLPINIMWAPAQGQIERNFGFRSMAFLELTGDAILYSVSVVLVLVGMGVWGPVIGVFAWQTWLFVSSYRVARIRPRWSWDREEIAHYRKFGRGFSLAVAADRSKDLVNPLVVGALAGSAAVGNVFLVLRLLESMGFVFRATWRLSLAALNRVRHDMTRFRRGIEEGMALQVLIVGPILAVACFAVGEVIPFVWGDEYPDAAEIFPLVAVATLSTGVTSMLVNALYSLGRTGAVLRANLVRAAFCAGFAALAVERNGVTGYGVGEIAGLISIVVLDGALRRELDFSYRRVLPWYGAFLPLIGITALPVMWRPVLLVPLMVMLLWPRTRGELVGYVRTVLASRTRAGTDDVDDDVADDGTDDGADSRDTADVAERELIAINGSAPMVTVASDPFVSAVTANATNWAEVASTAAERRNGPVILDAATAADGARSSNGAHHPHPTEARPVPTAKSPSSRNTARPSVDGRDVIFVAWTGRPARTHEIAQALGAEAKILPGHRTIKPLVPFRYLFQAFQTLFFLIRRRPDVVLVQNPPVVAAAVVCFYGRFSRCRVILDSHPGGFGAQGDRVSARLQWMHRWAVRHSSGVMVTTRDWVQLVNAWGGRGIVVHEPPPRFDVDAPTERPGRGRVLYVTVFAPDEPLIEVLEAARSLPDVEFVVTGDQRRCPSKIREQAPENVVFVGYLRGDDYVRALADADMVLALTS